MRTSSSPITEAAKERGIYEKYKRKVLIGFALIRLAEVNIVTKRRKEGKERSAKKKNTITNDKREV